MSRLANTRRNNFAKAARLSCLALAGGLLMAAAGQSDAAYAQAKPAAPQAQPGAKAPNRTQKAFDGWMVSCTEVADKSKRCAMTQTRIIAKTKQLLFAWSIARGKDGNNVGVLTTPTGVAVRDGIRLSVDGGEPMQVPFDICGPRACQARLALDDTFLKRLAAGTKASANFVAANKRMIQSEVDLKGFKAAYAYLVEQGK